MPGLPTAEGVIGPMAPDLATLEMILRTILMDDLSQHSFDVIEIPWDERKLEGVRTRFSSRGGRDGRLTFGIMSHDGSVRPHPPIRRALRLVAEALLARGHEVIDWQPPSHAEAAENLVSAVCSYSLHADRIADRFSHSVQTTWLHQCKWRS